jgi:hypothetical protein
VSRAPSDHLLGRVVAIRAQMAVAADRVAQHADAFAGVLEKAALRGDTARRLSLAAVEREISRIERRNAAKLRRSGTGPLQLEHLPPIPTFGTEPPDPAGCESPPGPT